MEVKARVLGLLAAQPRTKVELAETLGAAQLPSVQRCLAELQDAGVVRVDRFTNRWVLVDREAVRSLLPPHGHDLQAVMVAKALLEPLADDDLRARLRGLADRVRDREKNPTGSPAAASVDRPGEARIVIRNPTARWLAYMVWHADQVDTWLGPDLLERTLPYTSARELSRTLRSFRAGIVSIEPTELQRETLAQPSTSRSKGRPAPRR